MTLTSFLYRLARLSRDLNAVRRGPRAVGKRIIRKRLIKAATGGIGRILR